MTGDGQALTPKQAAFVEAYMVSGKGKASAIEAGYAANSAKVTACNLLKHPLVSAALERRRAALKRLAAEAGITPESVIEEYGRLGFSSLTDVVTWDDEGRSTIIASADLPRSVAVAIKKMKFKETDFYDKDGDVVRTNREQEIEMHPKQASLDSLAKHLDLFEEREKDGGNLPNLVLINIMQMQGTDG